MTWPPANLIAVTVDGAVLVNAAALGTQHEDRLSKLSHTFVGVRLTRREEALLRAALVEAATEAVARIDGARRARRRRRAR